jgi:hypothetical protein
VTAQAFTKMGFSMSLKPAQAGKAYDSVKETYLRNCVPSEEQAKAYLSMLGATAGLAS